MATHNKPANTLRCGNIKATIWQNNGPTGPFFSTTFSRPFKDQSGTWRNRTSFGLHDLEALLNVALEAKREQRRDFRLGKEILWESETAADKEVSQKGIAYITSSKSNDPAVGYNQWPKCKV